MKLRQKEKGPNRQVKSFGNKSKHIIQQKFKNCKSEEIWKWLV